MAPILFVNAVGSVVISALTLVAAVYLSISLWRQGRGKMRVRLLQGMVVSDVLLGLVAIVPESLYLSDRVGLKTGSGGCNASAFLIVTILFTQHLWTLLIALATFLLLKYPLSPITIGMEKWSCACAPIIWTISLLHAGIWWKTVGFASNGNLCYYGSNPISAANGVDARDLVQFIPRAFVFLFTAALYSRLYSFLRRPDTIQLSSQFVSGGTGSAGRNDGQMGKIWRRFGSGPPPPTRKIEPVNPDAPWEQLEFVQVGHGKTWDLSPVEDSTAALPSQPPLPSSGILLNSLPPSPKMVPSLSQHSPDIDPPPSLGRLSSTSSEGPITPGQSQRPSEADTLLSSEYKLDTVPKMSFDVALKPTSKTHMLSPVASAPSDYDDKSIETPQRSTDDIALGIMTANKERRTSAQSLKDFFQENQAEGLGTRTGSVPSGGKPQMSATAYFNRQASLLMLYFPLAYMVVFSVSLVRLIYGMIHKQPSPILSLLSSWMVLSVGLIDGLVYGLAELLVRRRVRRKMPDHI